MSLVPPTYLCCQPPADQAVSGKTAVSRPAWRPRARHHGRRTAARHHEIWLLPQQRGFNAPLSGVSVPLGTGPIRLRGLENKSPGRRRVE